jgi:catalase
MQANQTVGKGFFTAPNRKCDGGYVRAISDTFSDHWSQPRLFYNSLTPIEQQFMINAIRFETSHIKNQVVRQNVLTQLNKVSNDVAKRVAAALGMQAPAPDPQFYHENRTAGISIFNYSLPTVSALSVCILASTANNGSLAQAAALKDRLAKDNVFVTVVAETLGNGVGTTYSSADATGCDGVIVTAGSEGIFDPKVQSTLYP